MTIRRLNYTGLKRLKHRDMKVSVQMTGSGILEFDADLSFANYEFPAEALISIEAYRQTSWMRFSCGTIGNLSWPTNRRLEEFDSPDGVLFRVRVTSSDDQEGLLLAEADNIRPYCRGDTDQNQKALLSVKSDDDLGKQIFRVDMSDRPILLINSGAGDWKSVARDPVFCSLVYPAVVREILRYILRVEEYTDTEDSDDWKSQWLRFATDLPGIADMPADPDKFDDWIEEAASSFCRVHDMFGRFRKYWNEGDAL